jgi:methylated-DNA-protein-cysteine methyltransferase-like protein
MTSDNSFRAKVYELIGQVPTGMVTTYGDLAALAGHGHAARIVGGMAHYGPSELPWHRLVNRFGGLAAGFPGGREIQQQLLEREGVYCTDFIVNDFRGRRWQPEL